jgi:hypothetical protein
MSFLLIRSTLCISAVLNRSYFIAEATLAFLLNGVLLEQSIQTTLDASISRKSIIILRLKFCGIIMNQNFVEIRLLFVGHLFLIIKSSFG